MIDQVALVCIAFERKRLMIFCGPKQRILGAGHGANVVDARGDAPAVWMMHAGRPKNKSDASWVRGEKAVAIDLPAVGVAACVGGRAILTPTMRPALRLECCGMMHFLAPGKGVGDGAGTGIAGR